MVLVIFVSGTVALLAAMDRGWPWGECWFRQLAGQDCPFCGGTRALMHLGTGSWGQAWAANAFVVALVGVLVVGWLAAQLQRLLATRRARSTRSRAGALGELRPAGSPSSGTLPHGH
jgi:hypothetical protein